VPLLLLASGCARPPAGAPAGRAAATGGAGVTQAAAGSAAPASPPTAGIPSLTLEDAARPSPAAALVAAFAAVCAEPAQRPVVRAAARRGFVPVALAAVSGAALAPDAAAWRGPADLGDAVLLWDPGTAACELRAQGVDPAVAGAEFGKLQGSLEAEGASVLRMQPPPARFGAPGPQLMFLVTAGGTPEQARVLQVGADPAVRGGVVLNARRVAPRG